MIGLWTHIVVFNIYGYAAQLSQQHESFTINGKPLTTNDTGYIYTVAVIFCPFSSVMKMCDAWQAPLASTGAILSQARNAGTPSI